jgi:carboxypeptidase Taq
MTSSAEQCYQQLCQHTRQTALLASIESLLGWDERTLLPLAGGEYRAEQMTYLAGMLHQRHTDPRIGQWLGELADSELLSDPDSDAAVTVRQLRRDYDKKVKLPQSLVEELTRATVRGQQIWVEARKGNDFAAFQPILQQIIELKRQEADALGYAECRYDALLDEYEPGETTANVTRVLAGLREELIPLVGAIRDCERRPNVEVLRRRYPIDQQQAFGRQAASRIGFDFSRGRIDVTAHPFCTEMGPHDCRITTRYDERFFPSAFFGTLHEAGHGIYQLGLRPDQYGLPPGKYVSMGIHESQSRLWENLVGRSRPFWEHFYPEAQRAFPEALGGVSLDEFHFAINDVRPSLIRVEADEVTYNLHIIIRFELEQALISGELAVSDLPAAWNEKYQQYLGLEPPGDSDGVLQDIHWSAGLFGYFPTYSLGNLYAAQFFAKADAELGGLSDQFVRGDFTPLRQWLETKIHHQGQRYTAAQLAEQVTGQPLGHTELINYLLAKMEPLYSGTPPATTTESPGADVSLATSDSSVLSSAGGSQIGAATATAGALSDDSSVLFAPNERPQDSSGAARLGAMAATAGALSDLDGGAASSDVALAQSPDTAAESALAPGTSSAVRLSESVAAMASAETQSDSAVAVADSNEGAEPSAETEWSTLATRGETETEAEADTESFDAAAAIRTSARPQQYEIGFVGNLVGVVIFGFVGLAIGYLLLVWLGGAHYNFLDLSFPWSGE